MTEPDPALRAKFLEGMSFVAATVNVVTTDGPAGRAGVTVSAMSSVSADTPKPTLLVCVHHKSPAADAIRENGVFCVNILRDDQSYISDAFAGRFRETLDDKFDCADWVTETTGAPRVASPLAAFDCRMTGSDLVGTHYVFFGEVQAIYTSERGSPLVYSQRAYGRTSRIEPIEAPNFGAGEPTGGALRLACFHTFGPYILPEMLSALGGVDLTLIEGDHRRMTEALSSGEADLALLYDFDLGPEFHRELLAEMAPYVLLAADSPLAASESVSLHDLAREDMVLLDSPPSAEYFLSLFDEIGARPQIRYRSAAFEMVRGLVGRGHGFSILATKPSANFSYDGAPLTTRPIREKTRPSPVVLASRAGTKLPPSAESFALLCKELFEHEL